MVVDSWGNKSLLILDVKIMLGGNGYLYINKCKDNLG
jgi:hypothetical protein